MANKLMYIPNDDTQNYPLSKLFLVLEASRHSIYQFNQSKFPKVVKPKKRKCCLKLWGQCKKLSPLYLIDVVH